MSKTKHQTGQHLLKAMEREEKEAKSHKKLLKVMPEVPQSAHQLALFDHAVFTWDAPEYIQHPKSNLWYLVGATIAAAVIVGDIMTGNYTMALAVVVFAMVYMYLHNHHPPKDIKITISRMGIKVGNMVFPYSSIQAFWMHYQPPHLTTLNLRVKEHFFSDIIIQLHHEDPVPIREYLCGQIPEWEGKNERFGDIVLRLLKL